jgi:hypothetical protein
MLCCVSISFGQSNDFKIFGSLQSSDENLPLDAATVHVEKQKDSSLVAYTISESDGSFIIEDETAESKLNLFVSYVGYQTLKKEILLNKKEINVGKLTLELSNSLDEVVIKTAAPVTIKKDTLEFNVKSFKTKKDATVEDLLKKLPGVEIDAEGKIKINGKEVNKILVNGKPFFGDDPTITTKNLTKDIIEKIQVVDTKTKSEAYSGEDGDTENKTINLTIKEENNKGVFGRVAAGAGTYERWEFAGMFNRFDNDQRISILAGGNNINSPGFSFGEISKMFGRSNSSSWNSNGSFSIGGRSFGGGQGITTSKNAGLNYADKIGEKSDISADYFYSTSNSDNESASQRETFLNDSRFFSDSKSSSISDTDSHTTNLDYEVKIDTTLFLNIKPSFSYSNSTTTYNSQDNSFNEDRDLTNSSTLNSFVENTSSRFGNDLEITKKIGAKGAYIKVGFENEFSKLEGDDFINSNTQFFGTTTDITRDQFTDQENKTTNFGSDITVSIPLEKDKWFLNATYSFNRDKNENRQSTFNKNITTNEYDQFDTDLSTDFNYIDSQSRPGLRLRYKGEKLSGRLGATYVFRTLENQDELRPEFNVERDFNALEVNSYLNYRFSKKSSVYVNYRLNNNPPALSQLQAFDNVSNPLNTITGNPNLEPSNNHNIYFGFNSYDWAKKSGFYSYAGITAIENNVVSKTIVDPTTLKRTTTYENVDGNNNGYLGASYSKNFKLDSLKSIRVRVGGNSNFSKNINFNNEVKYASRTLSYEPSIGLEFMWSKLFEFKPRYSISFNNTSFDIDNFENQKFTRHNLGIETATFLPKKFEWRNDINYNYNTNIADGFQKSAWFWNSSLSYAILKDKGLVTLKVYDLLNQNTNATRVASQDYIEDRQSTVLTQYFMLNFSWKFNSLGAKANEGGGRHYYGG